MKLGIGAVGFGPKVNIDLERIRLAESLGFDSAWTAEAYGNDAVSTATWVLAVHLVGSKQRIRDRLQAWKEAGKKGWVHTLQIATPQREALELLAEEML